MKTMSSIMFNGMRSIGLLFVLIGSLSWSTLAQQLNSNPEWPEYDLRHDRSLMKSRHPVFMPMMPTLEQFFSHSQTSSIDTVVTPISDWLWGECNTVDLFQDSLMVIGNGQFVHVLRETSEDSTFIVGEYFTGSLVHDLMVRYPLAYVLSGDELIVLDLSDQAAPVKIGGARIPAAFTKRIVLEDSLAYITSYKTLTVVSIAQPENPKVRGSATLGEGLVYHAVRRGIVYLGYSYSFFTFFPEMIDCRDPDHLKYLGSFMDDGIAPGLCVVDTLLYAAGTLNSGNDHFLRIFSIADPDSPVVLSTYVQPFADSSLFYNVFVFDTLVYVGTGPFGGALSTFSVSRIDSIYPVQTILRVNARGTNFRIASQGDRVAVAQLTGVWSLVLGDTLRTVGYFMTGDDPSDVEIQGDHAFVVQPNVGLTILDISDPYHPNRVGAFEFPKTTGGRYADWVLAMAIDSPYAYVSAMDRIWVLNISTPQSIEVLDHALIDSPLQLFVDNGFLYSMQRDSGVVIFSLANRAKPVRIGEFKLPSASPISGIWVTDALCFWPYSDRGLRIIDVVDPFNPAEVSIITGFAGGAVAEEGLLYAAMEGGLSVYSLADSRLPMLLGSVEVPGVRGGVALAKHGDFLYMGLSSGYVLSVSDPSHPVIVGGIAAKGYVTQIRPFGKFIAYDDDDGLRFGINTLITSVEQTQAVLPTTVRLHQNYPNPFNSSTVIHYSIPTREHVGIEVYDILGRKVARIIDEDIPAGDHTAYWDSGNLSTGTYLLRLSTPSLTIYRKVCILK